jgi:L-asparagine transporter-like permease
MQLLREGDTSFWVYMLVTVTLGGAAAWASGSAIASTWRPPWQLLLAALALACVVRFFHYALFGEPLLVLRNFLVDYAVLSLFAGAGFQLMRIRQMVGQYPWAYEHSGLIGWRPRPHQQPF